MEKVARMERIVRVREPEFFTWGREKRLEAYCFVIPPEFVCTACLHNHDERPRAACRAFVEWLYTRGREARPRGWRSASRDELFLLLGSYVLQSCRNEERAGRLGDWVQAAAVESSVH
jgi:hypothetical protein